MMIGGAKPLAWVASSRADLKELPDQVQRAFGYALYLAQCGDRPPNAKPLKGFGGSGVVEVIEDHDRSTYRAVYTVQLEGIVYVLHVFQKKSKKGSATPKADLTLIERAIRTRDFPAPGVDDAGERQHAAAPDAAKEIAAVSIHRPALLFSAAHFKPGWGNFG